MTGPRHFINLTSIDFDMNDKVSSMRWEYQSCTTLTWDIYTGSLSGANANEFEPHGTYYYAAASARHRAKLFGLFGTDFDLRLWWWNGSAWTVVASALGSTSDEEIDYIIGPAGYYSWEVRSYSGSGRYELHVVHIP